ncbi:Uncharacterised protein [Klebsiella pneumoniae]|nr:Uncharacterised protein [Klebsiella pneumoniae]
MKKGKLLFEMFPLEKHKFFMKLYLMKMTNQVQLMKVGFLILFKPKVLSNG